MCSACKKVTNKTQVVAHQKVNHGGNLEENQAINATFTTPGGLVLAISAIEDNKSVRFHYIEVAGNATLEYKKKTKVTKKFVSLAVVQLKNSYTDGNKTANDPPSGDWTATECELSWCAKTYKDVEIVSQSLSWLITTSKPRQLLVILLV